MKPERLKNVSSTVKAQVVPDSSPDSLDFHFRKLSEYPLLDHRGEVALARRLERADLAISRALLSFEDGRQELAEVANALRAGQLRVEDVERNPTEPDLALAARIERAVSLARRRRRGLRTMPRAFGLRLHPRLVRALEHDLGERAVAERSDPRLDAGLRAVAEARRASESATAQFIQSNLRIVVTFARRYRGMPLVDLIQEGNLGLLRAVDKYDYRRGLRFGTYAAWWIRHALSRALADQGRMIRYPVHLAGGIQRVRRFRDRFFREHGREPTATEIAERTGIPNDQVRRVLDVVLQPVSLDAPIASNENATAELVEQVTAEAASVEDQVAARELRADTHALLAELSDREREIIRHRFGLGGLRQRTLEEVGARFSLSRERARQIERDALRKLRDASVRRRLRAHLQ